VPVQVGHLREDVLLRGVVAADHGGTGDQVGRLYGQADHHLAAVGEPGREDAICRDVVLAAEPDDNRREELDVVAPPLACGGPGAATCVVPDAPIGLGVDDHRAIGDQPVEGVAAELTEPGRVGVRAVQHQQQRGCLHRIEVDHVEGAVDTARTENPRVLGHGGHASRRGRGSRRVANPNPAARG
jgi:hypothetical protein